MKRRILVIWILLLLYVWPSQLTIAGQALDSFQNEIEYEKVQNVLDGYGDHDINFRGFVDELILNGEVLNGAFLPERIEQTILYEIKNNMQSFFRILAIAILAAVFTNFSHTFQNNQVSETAFYVTYLILYGILAGGFCAVLSTASKTISLVNNFMKALLPTYCVAIAFSTGSKTSMIMYEGTFFIIAAVDVVLQLIVLPCISIYMMIVLANNLSQEENLSKFAELLEMLIRWGLKSILAIVISIGTVQGMIAPVVDSLKRNSTLKAAQAIPYVGGLLGGVTETVLGAGVLLKNAIGVAGMICLIIICLLPLVKIAVCVLLYKLGSAFVQPVSDKRIVNMLSSCSTACSLLMQTVLVCLILFLLTITMAAYTSTSLSK